MQVELINPDNQKLSNWEGGSTTELYIFPINADYSSRDFQFRISTATCKLSPSKFTKLPKIRRKLLVLDGKIRLSREQKHDIILERGEQLDFDGDDNTISEGECTDFNLMLKDSAYGSIEYIDLEKCQPRSILYQEDFISFYCYRGRLFIKPHGKDAFELEEKSFCMITNMLYKELTIYTDQGCSLVCTRVGV